MGRGYFDAGAYNALEQSRMGRCDDALIEVFKHTHRHFGVYPVMEDMCELVDAFELADVEETTMSELEIYEKTLDHIKNKGEDAFHHDCYGLQIRHDGLTTGLEGTHTEECVLYGKGVDATATRCPPT